MALLLATVVDGLGEFARTIWGLQQRRLLPSTFEALSSAASSLVAALLICIVSLQWHQPGDLGLPFI